MDILRLLIKTSRMKGVSAIALGLVSGACSAGLIALINDAIIQGSPRSSIAPFIGLMLTALVANIATQVLLIDLSQDTVYRLRLQLSQRILNAPLQQLETLGASKLLAVLTEDIQAISNTVFIIPELCINGVVIAGCLVYLGFLSGWALVAVAIFLTIAIAILQLLINLTYRYLARVRQEIDLLYKQFRGVTDGTKELKLNAARRALFFDEDLKSSAAAARDYTKKAFKLGAISSSSGRLLFFILIGLLLFYANNILPSIQSVLPAYVLTITYLLGPLENIIANAPNLANAGVAIKQINQMGLSLSQSAELSTAVKQLSTEKWKTLQLSGVVHTYHNEKTNHTFSVGPIDLTIRAGELIFIVGGNGSGKSTLAKVIAGLYVPEHGKISLDGKPVVGNNREEYRQLFSAIFSDFYLFERLVSRSAIALKSETQTYLKKLQLETKVSIKDGQLSTTALSQGQRKRLALLTAYLEDRSIYLFDEWAADQDPVFRKIFYTQLLPELKQRGKTIIAISHDDHYFHIADRIIKLNYGQIEKTDKAESL